MLEIIRKHAAEIWQAALGAADPAEAVRRHFRRAGMVLLLGGKRYSLNEYRNVFVVGAGKASAAMARPVEEALAARIQKGLINVKYGHTVPLGRISVHECGHPVPDQAGVLGALRIASIARSAQERDLVICLVSGGASALLPLPAPPINLEQKQATTKLLLDCGANIHEINTVRKHISEIKGGQLARLAAPATLLTLMLSDVIGDNMDVIGSGPTVPDQSTYADAIRVVRKYRLMEKVPPSVRERLQQGLTGKAPETPKPGDPVFALAQNLIVGSNGLALDAAAEEARKLGYRVLKLSSFVEGETREIARMHAAIAKEIHATANPIRPPACIITGGETTVTIQGDGKGGRNQEFALAAAIEIAGLPRTVMFSIGTDGSDGPTDAAGALADGGTFQRALDAGLDARQFLDRNDSYNFFEGLGDLIKTGPTRTNVGDVRVILVGAP
jgi:hydroxypyruvate reductase